MQFSDGTMQFSEVRVHNIPVRNLHLLLADLDGMPVKIARGFDLSVARVYFKRKHMKKLWHDNVDSSRYYG